MYTALVKRLFVLVVILLTCINTFGQKAYFKLAQEHIKVGIEDYFHVTYIIGNADNIDQFAPPDFTNFEHVAAPSQSQSNRKYIQNGNLTQEKSISVTYTLKPNKIGTFKFSPASVKIDNQKFTTNSITIEVVKGSLAPQTNPRRRHPLDDIFEQEPTVRPRSNRNNTQNPQVREFGRNNLKNNIFLRLETNNEQPYVGQGVQVYYKLYTRLPMNMQLAKLPKFDHFWVEDTPLPPDLKPEVKVINGKEYNVFTIKQATIYPQKAGIFNLESVKAEGIVRVLEESNMRDPFEDDFFSDFFGENPFDDFFGTGLQMVDVPVSLNSTTKTITVKDLPHTDKKVSGVGEYTIEDEFKNSSITTDDVAQWIITIKGQGNLNQINLPDTIFHDNADIVLSETSDSITQRQPLIFGYKTFIYNIIPKTTGIIKIPSFDFTFFDPKKDHYYSLKSNDHELVVTQGKGTQIKLAEDNLSITSLKPLDNNFNYLDIIKYTIIILFIISILLFIIDKYNLIEKWNQEKSQLNRDKIAINRLIIAKNQLDQKDYNQFYIEINKALLLYIHDKFHISLSEMNHEAIKEIFEKQDISLELRKEFDYLYQYSNQALYMPNANVDATSIYSKTVNWLTNMDNRTYKTKGYSKLLGIITIVFFYSNVTNAHSMDSAYNAQDYKLALNIAYQEKSKYETNGDFLYNIGLIHQQLSNVDSAKYYFQKSLSYKKSKEAYTQLHQDETLYNTYLILSIFTIVSLLAVIIQYIFKIKKRTIPYQSILFKTTIIFSLICLVTYIILDYKIFS